MPSSNIVLVLDKSTSMRYYGFFTDAQTDCATFVNIMQPQDSVGVVTLSTQSQVVFPTSGQQQMVTITGLPVQNQAVQAIVGVTPAGITNFSDAIDVSRAMLASSPVPRAIVLLSDGEWNTGRNPLDNLPTDIPIHTIALGQSPGLSTLQQIAYRTVGPNQGYHFAPDGWDLASIYNDIVRTTGVAETAQNAQQLVSAFNLQSVPATIAAGSPVGVFSVNWTNPQVAFTPGAPTGTQINVSLRDPNGNRVTPQQTASGMGFVVLTVNQPLPGTWNVVGWGAQVGSLQTTVGAFEPGSPTTLDLSVDAVSARAGAPVSFTVAARHEGQMLNDLRVQARVDSPRLSLEQTLHAHRDALASVRLPDEMETEGNEQVLRLHALRRERLPSEDILQRASVPLDVQADGALLRGEVPDTSVAGGHTVWVQVAGRTPDGAPFSRVGRASFVVQ